MRRLFISLSALLAIASVAGFSFMVIGHGGTNERAYELQQSDVDPPGSVVPLQSSGVHRVPFMSSRPEAVAHDRAVDALRIAADDSSALEAPPGTSLLRLEDSQANVLKAFASETVDSHWMHLASRQLDTQIREHLPAGSRLESIECRTTMCKVHVVHRDPEQHGTFTMDGFLGWPGSVFVAGEQREQDGLAVTFVASREGTDPPFVGD